MIYKANRFTGYDTNLKLSPVYDECKRTITEAMDNVTKIELLEKDPENYIYEYFEDIKRKVDLRRETLKLKIDTCSDEIIQSIESAQSNCKKLSSDADRLSTDIEKLKTELSDLTDRFDASEVKDKKFYGGIKKEVFVFNETISDLICECKSSLLCGKEFTFDFRESDIENIFGCFEEKGNVKFNSTIVEAGLQNQLINLCEFRHNQKWELKYRASNDGFTPDDFHSKCNGTTNTLTVIKTTNGDIFGGYTEQAWHSKGGTVTDLQAFIFSLSNQENNPFKAKCSNNGERAIGCYSYLGPTFGDGLSSGNQDIRIYSDSNTNRFSFSNFGSIYKRPDHQSKSDGAQNVLTGSLKFQTVDIEVFAQSK